MWTGWWSSPRTMSSPRKEYRFSIILKTTDDDSPSTAFTQAGIVPWREFKRRSEREYLQWVLNQMGWNISATAYKLGISARQLFNKINEYNLENPQSGRPQKPVHSI